MDWLLTNWEWVLLGLLVADKVVAATPMKMDDLILTSIKGALRGLFPEKKI